ncbi:acyl-CoA dehydrogenase [Rhodococcus oxybenzonivorans]|uniref:Acyl-CoA dehydrogenase n=1 Tax=Rhodococcus oxybenzonivorans TaxID=1990687 RepID=A0A2S2BW62_9NOCA|nr:acyl-CoA dehydrogenase family protein [Rhodococcus oxybenzonivorans]AWK72885.1 acyl-CoA dehydrogenase [Rhodococcus oxybenzonivorans]
MTITTGQVDQDLVTLMNDVFGDYAEHHPTSTDTTLDREFWRRLDDLGLIRLTGPEESGGSGADWHTAAELLSAAVRHAVRVPLAEHDLLACAVLDDAGLPVDDAARTVTVLDEHGTATRVPWASTSDKVVTVFESGGKWLVADVPVGDLDVTPGANPLGEPRDDIAVDVNTLAATEAPDGLIERLRLKSALVRAIQVCAALDKTLELTVQHASVRTQFGRSLSRFQAVQHLIADMAAEAALARTSTEAALTAAVATDWAGANVPFLVATARSCTGHGASVVVRNAHQVHGAIGTTREHQLHHFTRPALTWRAEFGSVQHWDDQVAQAALSARDDLWGLITR